MPSWLCLPHVGWVARCSASTFHEEYLNLQRIKVPGSGPLHLNHSEQGFPRAGKGAPVEGGVEGVPDGRV